MAVKDMKVLECLRNDILPVMDKAKWLAYNYQYKDGTFT